MIPTESRPVLDDLLDHSNSFHNAETPFVRDRYNTQRNHFDAEINQKSILLKEALLAWNWFATSQDRIDQEYAGYTWGSTHEALSKLRTNLRYLVAQRIRIGGEGMSLDLKSDLSRTWEILSRESTWSQEMPPEKSGLVAVDTDEIQAGIMDFIDPKLLIMGAGALILCYVIFSK